MMRIVAALLAIVATILVTPAKALVSIDVTGGEVRALPIAIPYFAGVGEDAQIGQQIASVIEADLASSGLFRPIDRAAYISPVMGTAEVPRFGDWRAIGAESVVTGQVVREGPDRLRIELRLWDPLQEQQIIGQQFTTTPANWRRVAHIVADAVYERLTGETGYFDTRIAFVAETGPKNNRAKRLAIMDQDGANLKYLTDGKSLVLTPRFSPAGQQLTYMSYEGTKPHVYVLDVETGKRQLLGNFDNMSFAPRFSPDGRRVIMSLQEGGNANLYEMDLSSRQVRRLTQTPAIDTAPSYSPDGSQIVFESDRGGTQQIYVMPAGGGTATRISFGEGRYSTPVWSPRGDLIAFTKQAAGRFSIGVMAPDGSGERLLTTGFHNEGPTWAPNGRVLAFFRESGGAQGGPSVYSVDITGRNERRLDTQSLASDPAWSAKRQ